MKAWKYMETMALSKGVMYADGDGNRLEIAERGRATACCIWGALLAAYDGPLPPFAAPVNLVKFNDDPATTKEDVVAVLRDRDL